MSRKRTKSRKPTTKSHESIGKVRKKGSGFPSLKACAVIVAFVSVSFAAVAAYKNSWENRTDLSVIGSGVPVVVQVHDPSCSQCRQLKSNTESALSRLDNAPEYRIADLHTSKGRSLAAKYDAQKVTLLTFNSAGKFLDKIVGVRSVDSIESTLKELATRR